MLRVQIHTTSFGVRVFVLCGDPHSQLYAYGVMLISPDAHHGVGSANGWIVCHGISAFDEDDIST